MSYRDHNPICPFCGDTGSLRAGVEAYYYNVPLQKDGYVITDGTLSTDHDVIEIRCAGCKRDVPVNHYWHSPEKCNCKKVE